MEFPKFRKKEVAPEQDETAKRLACESDVYALIGDLDEIHSSAEVDEALIHLGGNEGFRPEISETSNQLLKGLEVLNKKYGQELVSNTIRDYANGARNQKN